MIFTSVQESRIKALQTLGIPMRDIAKKFNCKYNDIKQVVKNYPLTMTEQEAISILLG